MKNIQHGQFLTEDFVMIKPFSFSSHNALFAEIELQLDKKKKRLNVRNLYNKTTEVEE